MVVRSAADGINSYSNDAASQHIPANAESAASARRSFKVNGGYAKAGLPEDY